MLTEGDMAPDLALPSESGETARLSHLRGWFVVLYFYPKDDTPGCTAEALDFSALSPEFEAAGARIVAVSPDSADSHRRFKCKYALSLTLVSDVEHAAAEAYGVWVEKTMYGRTFMGVERSTFLIDGAGRIARIWRKVRVEGHAGEVLAAVRRA
jgi:peroxiredoxin Q/BCP